MSCKNCRNSELTMCADCAEVELLELGFVNVSFQAIQDQSWMFQLVNEETNLIANLSLPEIFILQDGRPTENKVFYRSFIPKNLKQIVEHFSGNTI